MNELELEKIEAVKRVLIPKFKNSDKESVFISFDELSKEPELEDQMGCKKVFAFLERSTNNNISFEIVTKRKQLTDRAGQDGTYPQLTNALPIGIQVHVSNPSRIASYFEFNYPIKLSEHKVSFDKDKAIIEVDNRVSQLPNLQDEHEFCKFMFNQPAGVAIDWSTVYKEIHGTDPIDQNEKTRKVQAKSLSDTIRRINKRVQTDLNTPDSLFSSIKKNVKRNF